MKPHIIIKWSVAASLLICILSGCSSVRTEVFRNETRHLYMQGNKAYQGGDYEQAAGFYSRVIKLDPGYARAYVGLGNIALISKDYKKAKKHYRHAVTLSPQLKRKIMALLFESSVQAGSSVLKEWELNLQKICELMDKGQFQKVDRALSTNVPLDLLAEDSGSMLLVNLCECREKVAKRVRKGDGSARFMLFAGYALSVVDGKAHAAVQAFELATASGSREDKKKAYLALAGLYNRMDEKDRAVDAYLKAVDAGVSMETVAPALAALYGLPVEEITGNKEAQADTDNKKQK
jgi:tetratricopeptide (TPR) repeat protein